MNRIIVNSRSGINLSLKSSGWPQTSVVLGKSNPLYVYTERIWIERTAIAFRRMNSWRLSVVRGVLVIWGEVEREAETWELISGESGRACVLCGRLRHLHRGMELS